MSLVLADMAANLNGAVLTDGPNGETLHFSVSSNVKPFGWTSPKGTLGAALVLEG